MSFNVWDVVMRNDVLFIVTGLPSTTNSYYKISYRLRWEPKQNGYTNKESTDVLIWKEYKWPFNSEWLEAVDKKVLRK